MVATGRANPAGFVAIAVVAQGVMMVASLVAMRLAERQGYWPIMLLTLIALPIRGLVTASLITSWGAWPVRARPLARPGVGIPAHVPVTRPPSTGPA